MVDLDEEKIQLSVENQKLRERVSALEAANAFYRTVSNFTYDWETWVDSAGRIVVLNSAVAGLIGLANKTSDFTEADAFLATAFGEIAAVALAGNCTVGAMRRSEERLRMAQDAAKSGTWEWDPRTGTSVWSEELWKLYGLNVGCCEPSYDSWLRSIHPDDRAAAVQGSELNVEWRGNRPGEAERWFMAHGRPRHDTDGRIVDYLGIVMDITERKRAEAALRESEANYRTLFETMTQGVVYHDKNGAIITANPAAERILGFSVERMRGQSSQNPRWRPLCPDGAEFPDDQYPGMKALRTGKPVTGVILGFRHPTTGDIRWLLVDAIPEFRSGESRPWRVFSTFSDITDLKRAEEEKEKLGTQLLQAQKMESVGRLAGGVAHDFNNMLQTIIGNVELALEEAPAIGCLRECIEEIHKAATRSAALTRQLLTFARKQMVTPEVLELNETVSGIIQMLRRVVGEGTRLEWLPGDDLHPVEMDPSQVDQILANLSLNAREAIAEKGGVGKITIGTENIFLDEARCREYPGIVPGEYVLLTVTDNGDGMDQEILAHVFEPFFSTKEMGKGTGLGLATVYGIVQQNGGFIAVDSAPGQGTAIRIHLPRYEGDPREVRPDFPAGMSRHGTETVLVVEDDPSILQLTEIMLRRMGYAVLTAGRPGQAIQMAGEYNGRIHLLITDVIMPEMNGRDLAEDLRNLKPDMECLFMSGYAADIIARHGVLEEGVVFLRKPFSHRELAEGIRKVLGP